MQRYAILIEGIVQGVGFRPFVYYGPDFVRSMKIRRIQTPMHELSIAMSIVEIAGEEAERRALSRIQGVHLKLGALSGMVQKALVSAYELAREGSRVEGAALIIQEPTAAGSPGC